VHNGIDGLVSESNVIPVFFLISTALEGCSPLDLIKFYAPARNFLLICLLFGSRIRFQFGFLLTHTPSVFVVQDDQVDRILDKPVLKIKWCPAVIPKKFNNKFKKTVL